MGIANPRVHIICGFCGCNKMLEYHLSKDIDDDTDEERTIVYISCGNCSSLTSLDELMPERKKE